MKSEMYAFIVLPNKNKTWKEKKNKQKQKTEMKWNMKTNEKFKIIGNTEL